MTAFRRICIGCRAAFRPTAADHRRCPTCQRWKRTGSTRAWRRQRARILAENPVCQYCGGPATTVDHVIPLARGGTDDLANLVPACAVCNGRKGALKSSVAPRY
jgi:5-methylcytosine-specific restriction endonuclease McrA